MKPLLVMLPLLLAAGGAAAIERYDVSRMSCDEIKSALQSSPKGKALLMTPSSKVGMKYDIYVADRAACGAPPSGSVWASVKAADGSCHIYKCQQIARPHANK